MKVAIPRVGIFYFIGKGETMCIFCKIKDTDDKVIWSNEYVIAKWDDYPVSDGHCIIITREHYETWGELPWIVKNSVLIAVDEVRAILKKEYNPDAFNIGFNDGIAAGQTVMHQHTHIIPRYSGDCNNPRGGIRHCALNDKGDYTNDI